MMCIVYTRMKEMHVSRFCLHFEIWRTWILGIIIELYLHYLIALLHFYPFLVILGKQKTFYLILMIDKIEHDM